MNPKSVRYCLIYTIYKKKSMNWKKMIRASNFQRRIRMWYKYYVFIKLAYEATWISKDELKKIWFRNLWEIFSNFLLGAKFSTQFQVDGINDLVIKH